jgi:hypothetical protein
MVQWQGKQESTIPKRTHTLPHLQDIPPKSIVKTNIEADEANALVKKVKFC